MSELKAYLCIRAREIENKTFSCYNQTLAVKNAPEATMAEVYLKSEADKVVAELKEKHKTEVKELLCLIRDKENNFNRAFDSEEKELRHQKHKRCLDKAKLCESEEKRLEAIAPIFDTDKECWEYSSDYWNKWRNRWLELAEKFKHN